MYIRCSFYICIKYAYYHHNICVLVSCESAFVWLIFCEKNLGVEYKVSHLILIQFANLKLVSVMSIVILFSNLFQSGNSPSICPKFYMYLLFSSLKVT
jgi:hypothetical protein